jgi:RecA-family ATPase
MRKSRKCLYVVLMLSVLTLLPLAGCGMFSGKPTSSGDQAAALPPISAFADDLQDIELPSDLEWNRDKSMGIKTESFRGGVWQYNGRVEAISLKDFIVSAMQNHNWKPVGEITAEDILLAFIKPGKNCMMVISESWLGNCTLTLYVTIDKTAAAGLNPFGEAVHK